MDDSSGMLVSRVWPHVTRAKLYNLLIVDGHAWPN